MEYSLPLRTEKNIQFTIMDGEKSTVYHEGWRKMYSLPLRMEKKAKFITKDGENLS